MTDEEQQPAQGIAGAVGATWPPEAGAATWPPEAAAATWPPPQAGAGAEPGQGDPDAEAEHNRRKGRGIAKLLPAPVWHIGKLLVVALIVEYFVVPQIAGTRKAWHQLTQVSPLLLLAGVALECAAIACYAQLTRSVLPQGTAPRYWTVLRIQLTTLSVSHCVPGGTAAGSGLGYRLMTNAGVKGPDVGFALGTQAIGSAVVLNLILWVALIISIPITGFSPVYGTAAVAGVVLIGLFTALVLLLTKGEERASRLLLRLGDRIPFVDGPAVVRLFEQVAGRLGELLAHRSRLRAALVWGAANWLLDAASLWVFVGAFGHWTSPDGLLVAFGVAYVLAAIPLTPGGLGVVEATLTSTLVGFSTPRAIAILGVVSYRLVNFWAPIPVGGLTYLSLQVDSGGAGRRGALLPGRLRHLEERAREAASRVRDPGGEAGARDPGTGG